MSLHADLLKQALHLATKEPRRPSQASLRRAISAAYYALFHRLVDEPTRMTISRGNRDSLRECFSRAFHHSDMKDVCKSFANNQAPKKLSPAFDGLLLDPSSSRSPELSSTYKKLGIRPTTTHTEPSNDRKRSITCNSPTEHSRTGT